MYFLNGIVMKLTNISVENSTGYGVVGVNVLGHSSTSHSKFLFNNYYTLNSTNCSPDLGLCKGGNMYLFYVMLPEPATLNTNSVMSIDSCVFRNGVDLREKSSGLSIISYTAAKNKTDVFEKVISKRSLRLEYGIMDFYYGDFQITNTALPYAVQLAWSHELGTDYLILPSFVTLETLPSTPKQTYPPNRYTSPQILTTEQSTLLAVHIHVSDSKFHNNIGGCQH